MLNTIKHVTINNFVLKQDSLWVHQECNTVQMLQHETLNFISPEL